jgi:hypothetical protein
MVRERKHYDVRVTRGFKEHEVPRCGAKNAGNSAVKLALRDRGKAEKIKR